MKNKKIMSLIMGAMMTTSFIPTTIVSAATNNVSVSYSTHVQKQGWQKYVKDGEQSGTTGQSLRLEGVKIKVEGDSNLGIEYSSHVQGIGWQNFVSNDSVSGTEGKAKRLEAIKIRLTGEDAGKYDIYYRVHSQKFGWLDWAKNGEPAGTSGYGYRLESLEIEVVPKGSAAPGATSDCFKEKPVDVSYSTHVQSYGWQKPVANGKTSGTVGKAKRVEGIKINLSDTKEGHIEYSSYVQKQGWQKSVKDGAISGTQGKSLRLEAIKINLTDKLADKYDIYYRVHSQKFGWLDWAKNGEPAGTVGYGYRLEGIEIKVLPKGSKAPGAISNCFKEKSNEQKPQQKVLASPLTLFHNKGFVLCWERNPDNIVEKHRFNILLEKTDELKKQIGDFNGKDFDVYIDGKKAETAKTTDTYSNSRFIRYSSGKTEAFSVTEHITAVKNDDTDFNWLGLNLESRKSKVFELEGTHTIQIKTTVNNITYSSNIITLNILPQNPPTQENTIEIQNVKVYPYYDINDRRKCTQLSFKCKWNLPGVQDVASCGYNDLITKDFGTNSGQQVETYIDGKKTDGVTLFSSKIPFPEYQGCGQDDGGYSTFKLIDSIPEVGTHTLQFKIKINDKTITSNTQTFTVTQQNYDDYDNLLKVITKK